MSNLSTSTLPKPFVFVLMPFEASFEDIYKFGIKGSADDVGAYAERIDEQIFTEGMLDRIFNQISRADVVVADMTGRNPNVFYEVGYAHALGKIVVLLTQNTDDIPFDLKHRQHTVYGGSIDLLRKELAQKLQWAITESRRDPAAKASELLSIKLLDIDIPKVPLSDKTPSIEGSVSSRNFRLPIQLRNDSLETISGITHVYLFTTPDSTIVPTKRTKWQPVIQTNFSDWMNVGDEEVPLESFTANPIDAQDGLTKQYRLHTTFQALPPGAVEISYIDMMFVDKADECNSSYRIRLHSPVYYHDFPFKLNVRYSTEGDKKEKSVSGKRKGKKSGSGQKTKKEESP